MKRNLRFIFILIILIILSACNNSTKEIESNYFTVERLEKDIREYRKIDPKKLDVFFINKIKEYKGDDYISVITYILFSSFDFADGRFEEVSGYFIPAELIYIKDGDDYKLSELKEPSDGQKYNESILSMVRNDKKLQREISDYKFPSIAESLIKKANELGLKDFIHKQDQKPGFTGPVVVLPTGDKSVVHIANKKDYDMAKKSIGQNSWQSVDAVEYYKDYGVAIKRETYIDNEIEMEMLVKAINKYKNIPTDRLEFVGIRKITEFDTKNQLEVLINLYTGKYSLEDKIFKMVDESDSGAKLVFDKKNDGLKLVEIEELKGDNIVEKALEWTRGDKVFAKMMLEKGKVNFASFLVDKAISIGLKDFYIEPSEDGMLIYESYENEGQSKPIKVIEKKDLMDLATKQTSKDVKEIRALNYYPEQGIVIESRVNVEELLDKGIVGN